VLDLRGPLRMEIEAAMRARLPEIVSRLGCQGFFATRFEMHLLAYPEGGHYRAHRDTYRDPPDGGRRISLACPLRPPGAAFTGGDLVLLGDDGEPTVLPFRHNTATAFASDRLHEVLPVAGTGEGILGCRIAIAAWFHGARLVPVVTC
jgi:Rps23 Pro-64 3,4-dihydroxylase Tpa1-like proline 4-hydroxylase